MHIACFGVSDPLEVASLKALEAEGHTLSVFEEALAPHNTHLAATAEVLSLFTYATVPASVFEALPHLRCVTVRSTGCGNYPLEALTQRRIPLLNTQHYCTAAVAEQAAFLMLALARNLNAFYTNSRQGHFARHLSMAGVELDGKTLGVWGAGPTAQRLMRIGQGLGMAVLCHNRTVHPALQTQGVTFVDWPTLQRQSDVLSSMVPVTPQTQNRLNAEALAAMKPTALLVNVARGELIDSSALLAALEAGQLAGAGLDVLPSDATLLKTAPNTAFAPHTPEGVDQALMRHPKVVHSPHVAFMSPEALARWGQQSLENIQAFINGQPLVRQVNVF